MEVHLHKCDILLHEKKVFNTKLALIKTGSFVEKLFTPHFTALYKNTQNHIMTQSLFHTKLYLPLDLFSGGAEKYCQVTEFAV